MTDLEKQLLDALENLYDEFTWDIDVDSVFYCRATILDKALTAMAKAKDHAAS